MTTLRTKYLGNMRTEIEHVESGQKVITDAPVDNHGKGEYISPTDLFVASYVSCILTIMDMAGDRHGFEINGVFAETTKVMASNPRRVSEMKITITLPHNNYSDKERRVIEAVPAQCPVGNSLHPEIKKEIIFVYGE